MRQIIPIILVTLISCTVSNEKNENVAPENNLTDYEVFMGLFEKRLIQIPDRFIIQFLQVDTLQIDNVWTYEKVKFSDDFTGLVYKATCMAGGLCERFVLVIFDKSGNKMSETEVGHKYADYGGSSELTYSFDKEIIELKLKETELLEAEDETDKEQITVDSTYYNQVDLKSGQVIKD